MLSLSMSLPGDNLCTRNVMYIAVQYIQDVSEIAFHLSRNWEFAKNLSAKIFEDI